jgi:hypothetical protein
VNPVSDLRVPLPPNLSVKTYSFPRAGERNPRLRMRVWPGARKLLYRFRPAKVSRRRFGLDNDRSRHLDAIQEFKAQSHTDQAEYGHASGAVVSVVSKGGTNTFHGAAYWFVRNDAFDAKNAFDSVKLPYHQNQYGGSVGAIHFSLRPARTPVCAGCPMPGCHSLTRAWTYFRQAIQPVCTLPDGSSDSQQ